MPVIGIGRVRGNIKKHFARVKGPVTERAVYMVLSQGGALADTLTPVETGFLVNSRYNPHISMNFKGVEGEVGYLASYAGAVHEMPGTLTGLPRSMFGDATRVGNFWDPAAEPHFLTKGFLLLEPSIPRLLRSAYNVG